MNPSEPRLTVHHATQTPYQFQDLYSRHYGIPEASVRVIAPDIGGSFGMKLHVYHEDMAVVGLSMMLGRPVKYVADRIESFVSDIHARDHRVRARMAWTPQETILAMDVEDVTGIGAFSAYPRTSVVEGNQVIRLIGAPYRLKSYRAEPAGRLPEQGADEPVPRRRPSDRVRRHRAAGRSGGEQGRPRRLRGPRAQLDRRTMPIHASRRPVTGSRRCRTRLASRGCGP